MITRELIAGLLLLAGAVNAVKILCVFPVMSHSHQFIGRTLMKELARRGHNVTFVSPFPEKEPVENMRTIVLTGFAEEWEGTLLSVEKLFYCF